MQQANENKKNYKKKVNKGCAINGKTLILYRNYETLYSFIYNT